MSYDAMMGYLILALEEENLDEELIKKIICNIQDLEDVLDNQTAQTTYYDFFD